MRNKKSLSKALLAATSNLHTAGFEADYQRHVAAALAIPAADVHPMRVEAELGARNATVGGSLVLEHETQLAKSAASVSADEIRQLPSYASALLWADGIVRRYEPTPSDVKKSLSRGRELRSLMLAAAVMLSLTGSVSAATVAKIKKGRGPRDTAQDCIDLSVLLGGVPADAAAKMAVTSADLAEARTVGELLLTTLKPKRAKRVVNKEHAAAVDMRDRMWTLLDQRWERHVWLAGAILYGRAVDKYIPTLGARTSKTVQTQQPVAPAPVAPAPVAPSPVPVPTVPTNGVASAAGATASPAARAK
jgi:hypothetical protein|nr:hypothetical protein [Kofleriaceae bacterium]